MTNVLFGAFLGILTLSVSLVVLSFVLTWTFSRVSRDLERKREISWRYALGYRLSGFAAIVSAASLPLGFAGVIALGVAIDTW